MDMRLALAQIDVTVGDLGGNRDRILAALLRARQAGADVVAFPELVVTGYPPEDLLLQHGFVGEAMRSVMNLAAATRGLTAIVGTPWAERDGLYDAAAVLHDGRLAGVYRKQILPNYGVFDEQRYFRPGRQRLVFERAGFRVGVNICEDIWYPDGPPSQQAASGGAALLVNLSASPYHRGKGRERERMLATRGADALSFVAYCNLVGGQDELVFDGQSLVCGPDGRVLARACQFEEDVLVADLDLREAAWQRSLRPGRPVVPEDRFEVVALDQPPPVRRPAAPSLQEAPGAPPLAEPPLAEPLAPEAEAYAALVLGTRDYVGKNGFDHAVLGLSGGIDSSLAVTVAVDALGSQRVSGVAMPSRYSSSAGVEDARELAANLGIELLTVPIDGVFQSYLDLLGEPFAGRAQDVTEENLQARIRGMVLMALSNKFGWLVLTTGDKSEVGVGFMTLYGDMAGGFDILKDVPKTLAYRLARHRNRVAGRDLIPERVLRKPPSPELKADQKATDTLPDYAVLDPLLHAYVEEGRSAAEIAARGFDPALVARVIRMVDRAEYKRRQAPPGVRIAPRAFGRDRRMPITNRFDAGALPAAAETPPAVPPADH